MDPLIYSQNDQHNFFFSRIKNRLLKYEYEYAGLVN